MAEPPKFKTLKVQIILMSHMFRLFTLVSHMFRLFKSTNALWSSGLVVYSKAAPKAQVSPRLSPKICFKVTLHCIESPSNFVNSKYDKGVCLALKSWFYCWNWPICWSWGDFHSKVEYFSQPWKAHQGRTFLWINLLLIVKSPISMNFVVFQTGSFTPLEKILPLRCNAFAT